MDEEVTEMAKTNMGLVEYAKAQLGRPYWMGTFGQFATEWLYNYNKGRLPAYYTDKDFPSQYGQKVHDCIGLIKGQYIFEKICFSNPRSHFSFFFTFLPHVFSESCHILWSFLSEYDTCILRSLVR